MLERMREGSQGVVAKSILIVIILSFALAGVSSYLGTSSVNAAVTVNGEEISQQSVEQAYQNERARLQQQYGEQFELLASNPNFAQQVRAQATQTLITERLVAQAVADMGLRVGDEQVKEAIRNTPEFQVDGKFDNNLYLSLLRNNNLSPAQFSANFKTDLVRVQLLETLVGSEFVLPSEVAQTSQLQGQQRVARILNVDSADFVAEANVTAEDIETYYANNSQAFQSPEQVNVEYIVLDSATLTSEVNVTEQDVQDYYDQHQSDYEQVERRKVAHIFIQGDSDEAKAKAEAILEEIKSGADFAELAKTKSEDVYSAKNDGELDWFERGVMDPAFDSSAFSLTKASPISDVVKSEFGYHIIKLIDAQENTPRPLSEVKPQIEVALKNEKVRSIFDDLYQRLSEVAFESPDSLEEASAEVGVAVQESGLFSSDDVPNELDSRDVLSQVFDENFRAEGLNSEVIDLTDSKAIVVRVKDYQEAATKPLAEVTDQITVQLEEQKSAEAAKQFVESLMTKLNAGESIDSELASKDLTFSSPLTLARYSRDYDTQIIQRLFQLAKPEAGQVTRDYVATAQGDFALVELSDVIEQDESKVEEETEKQLAAMLQRSTSEATYQALITLLLNNADITYAGQ
ncbi:peptidylprolyl isomerase [Psychromonas sp. 14N.309.X.WAT.B.A12]|uniref:peptidylprolyl isomerase n=1 Tax=Psychromonas sp. 14N.309.X.WAT.B.A12 TaxID=2998322 RepID=UPI0025B1FBAA|nr:peptidylprolyl isomerase [Psychromonas sp. 14N.309.X.WAT.B.A12]MDN2662353.1 peptidylprolyl isomerase [Psychromonas sp. 14N.309.X.WAT.B.A12]